MGYAIPKLDHQDSFNVFGIRTAHMACLLGLSLFFLPVYAIQRSIGDPSDPVIQNVVKQCFSSDPQVGFGYGKCPNLLRCAMENLPADVTAGMQSGANIASLVPTILALISASPLDLVQLAFVSPARAVATSIFAIGLPSGLFRQLRFHVPRLSDEKAGQPDKREWRIPVPQTTVGNRNRAIKSIVTDLVILALAGVMLWRNIVVGSQTMVTWRCEYSWLLACWPIACGLWMIVALGLLHILAKKIEITYSEDAPGVRRSRLDLLLLPYRTPVPRVSAEALDDAIKPPTPVTASSVPPCKDDPVFIVRVQMRYKYAWSWFEATIETLAVGIYLYATFVLTSSLFIVGSAGIGYATVMVICLSAIRVLELI